MKKLLVFLLPLILLSSKCKEDSKLEGQGVMSINVRPNYNGKPFVINQIYNIGGKNVRFTRLNFLLTETCPKVNSSDGSCGSNAHMIDLTTLDDLTKSEKGFTQILSNLTEGSKNGLQMSLGVAPSLNASLPKNFPSSNPLSDGGAYWADWNSYIFTKIEGLMDKDGNGTFETGITLHTGGDDSFRQTWFPQTFTVDTKGSTTLNFDLNINSLLRGIDLSTVNSTHQTGDKPTMLMIMNNLKDGITLK